MAFSIGLPLLQPLPVQVLDFLVTKVLTRGVRVFEPMRPAAKVLRISSEASLARYLSSAVDPFLRAVSGVRKLRGAMTSITAMLILAEEPSDRRVVVPRSVEVILGIPDLAPRVAERIGNGVRPRGGPHTPSIPLVFVLNRVRRVGDEAD